MAVLVVQASLLLLCFHSSLTDLRARLIQTHNRVAPAWNVMQKERKHFKERTCSPRKKTLHSVSEIVCTKSDC